MTVVQPRYAIYFTPPVDHPLTQAAVAWLGRDAFDPANTPAIVHRDASLTTEPRRYGFHATLKAPFRLAPEARIEDFEAAVARFAATHRPFPVVTLRLEQIGGFYALVPDAPCPALNDFAGAVVGAFDGFRAPPTDDELARRKQADLDDVETAHLERWGYPYVFERFRFHMTLSNRVTGEEASSIEPELRDRFDALARNGILIDALALFEESEPGADFHVRSYFQLGAGL